MKKIVSLMMFVASFVGAQMVHQEGLQKPLKESDLPVMNINHVDSDEPVFTIAIHPVSLILINYLNTLYLTVEGNVGSQVSMVTRPFFAWYSDSDRYEELDVWGVGASLGPRMYFGPGHRGLYADGVLLLQYAEAERNYESYYNGSIHEEASAVAFGGGFYMGYKIRKGNFTSSLDIGVLFVGISVDGDKDDVEKASKSGFTLDMNYTIGLAF